MSLLENKDFLGPGYYEATPGLGHTRVPEKK
jgi:hypothetical protein